MVCMSVVKTVVLLSLSLSLWTEGIESQNWKETELPKIINFLKNTVKVNNSLSRPFPVQRGIRQGCCLSGMLYSLSIEPLLHQLRLHLTGLAVPALPHALPIQLSAYADDLNVFVTGDRDVATLQDCIHSFERASSARVNWTKSGAYLVGSWTLSWNTVGLKILGVFLDFRWRSSRELSVLLGIRSERFLEKMLADLKASLSPAVSGFVEMCLTERVVLEPDPLFPTVLVSPSVPLAEGEQPGRLLSVHNLTELHFHAPEKKQLYHLCVKSHCSPELRDLVDTKWRAHLGVSEAMLPSWCSLYKLPLPKRSGDLQWRVLHSIVATNRYLSHVETGVSEQCPFCPASETVYHLFTDYPRLLPLFQHLTDLLASFGVIFSKTLLVFSITYKSKQRQKCVLVNFILGQAKLAIYKSRKNKILATGFTDAWSVFRVLLVSRIQVDFFYYKFG